MLFYIHFCKQQRGTNRENYATYHLLFSPSGTQETRRVSAIKNGALSKLEHNQSNLFSEALTFSTSDTRAANRRAEPTTPRIICYSPPRTRGRLIGGLSQLRHGSFIILPLGSGQRSAELSQLHHSAFVILPLGHASC